MDNERLSEQINIRVAASLKEALERRAQREGRRLVDITRRLWALWLSREIDPFAQSSAQTQEGDKENGTNDTDE